MERLILKVWEAQVFSALNPINKFQWRRFCSDQIKRTPFAIKISLLFHLFFGSI